jgi:hypothetical protein
MAVVEQVRCYIRGRRAATATGKPREEVSWGKE